MGVGDLRTALARLPDRRPRAAGARATRRGTTGRSRSSTRSRPIGCACSRSCPAHSPEAAAAELERCAALGHRGAIIGVFDIDVGDPAWDRLWAAAERHGLPISFHIKGGTSSKLSYQIGKWQSAAFATLLPLQLDEPLATMVFCGALERHPGLKLVLAESGVGWLPYFLARMDLEWHALRDKLDYAPKLAPSELFRRQVIATFEEDALARAAHPAARRRLVHVGVGLPAHRQHVPRTR